MKAGDLVTIPESRDPLGRTGSHVGVIVNSEIVQNRIAVMWPTRDGIVSYEPIMFLEVLGENG